MKAIRGWAAAIVILLALYFAMRAAASGCSGAACDAYIPVSLLLPLLILVTTAVAGVLAIRHASGTGARFVVLVVVTVIGVIGPAVSLLVFRDSPDYFVGVSTVLVLLVAIATLSYSFLGRPLS